jgi:hypothetical protein
MRACSGCSWLGSHLRERPKLLLLLLLLGVTVVGMVVMRNPLPVFRLGWDVKEASLYADSKRILDWEGFGPEKG